MQLLKLCDYAIDTDDIHMYKSLDLTICCDAIWRDVVCKSLGWEFKPVV